MTEWKKKLSADDVRYLVDWFTDTYDEAKAPRIWTPSRAEALAEKITEIQAREAGG
jgi:hypothetical protein